MNLYPFNSEHDELRDSTLEVKLPQQQLYATEDNEYSDTESVTEWFSKIIEK